MFSRTDLQDHSRGSSAEKEENDEQFRETFDTGFALFDTSLSAETDSLKRSSEKKEIEE